MQGDNPRKHKPQQNATSKEKYASTWKPRERKQLYRA